MLQGLGGREGAHVLLARAGQHLHHVGDVAGDVVLDPGQAAGHPQQMIQRDPASRIAGGVPRGHARRGVDVERAVADRDADQDLGDALGHRPGAAGHVRAVAGPVAFEDQAAALDDHHPMGLAHRA